MWYKSEYVYQFCSKYLKHISTGYLHLVKEEADMLISVLGIEDVDQSSFLIKYIYIYYLFVCFSFEDTNDLYEMLLDLFVQLLMEREYDVRIRSMILRIIKQFSVFISIKYIYLVILRALLYM